MSAGLDWSLGKMLDPFSICEERVAEVSNAVPELVVSGYYYSPRATISQEPLRHVVRLKRWSGDRHSRYSWKLSQKEAKYKLDNLDQLFI